MAVSVLCHFLEVWWVGLWHVIVACPGLTHLLFDVLNILPYLFSILLNRPSRIYLEFTVNLWLAFSCKDGKTEE